MEFLQTERREVVRQWVAVLSLGVFTQLSCARCNETVQSSGRSDSVRVADDSSTRAARPAPLRARFFLLRTGAHIRPPAIVRLHIRAPVLVVSATGQFSVALFAILIYNGRPNAVSRFAAADSAEDVRRDCAGAGAGRRPRRPVAAQPCCIAKRHGGRFGGSFAGGEPPCVSFRSRQRARARAHLARHFRCLLRRLRRR